MQREHRIRLGGCDPQAAHCARGMRGMAEIDSQRFNAVVPRRQLRNTAAPPAASISALPCTVRFRGASNRHNGQKSVSPTLNVIVKRDVGWRRSFCNHESAARLHALAHVTAVDVSSSTAICASKAGRTPASEGQVRSVAMHAQ